MSMPDVDLDKMTCSFPSMNGFASATDGIAIAALEGM